MRAVAHKTGTVTSLACCVAVSSGNIKVGIASIAAEVLTITQLASQACPAGGAWRGLGNPSFAVTRGQIVYFVLEADNTTATFNADALGVVGMHSLVDMVGLLSYGYNNPGSFTIPATLALSACTVTPFEFLFGGKIT